MSHTTTCLTCNTTTPTAGPWNDSVVWCDACVTRIHATRTEILRLKALQREGRILAGMGVRPWDRERGAQTAQRATTALVALFADLTMDDMTYIHDLDTAGVNQ